MEDLTLWVIQHVAKMPREHRFTIGDRWVDTCLEVTTLLTEATYTRDRLPLLARAARALTRARLLCRLAQRLHLCSAAQRDFFGDASVEVGKMLGGWTRAAAAR